MGRDTNCLLWEAVRVSLGDTELIRLVSLVIMIQDHQNL